MHRFFILFIYIGMVISYTGCVSDQKDKDLISIQTFLERHDKTEWSVIEKDMRIYIRFNDDMDKALEIWMSELELAKLMGAKECFYYSQETLNTEDIDVLKNSSATLEFTHLDNETWIFSRDGDRLKLEFKTLNSAREPVYFSESKEDVVELSICTDEKSKAAFDWKFLK